MAQDLVFLVSRILHALEIDIFSCGCVVATVSRNGVEDGEAQYPEIERKYTPISGNELKGYVELVVKVYRRGEQKQFPDGGKMSQYLDSLKIGDNVDVMGPCG